MDSGDTEHHPRTVTGLMVAAKARELIGAPYLHQGRTMRGIDCVGVPLWVMHELSILPSELPPTNYGRIATGELIKMCEAFCTKIEVPEIGCLITFKWPGEKEAGHAAIRTPLGIVHSYRNHGGVREHGYRGHWPKWTDSFWRLPGVI
jgi:cell wall-associated NlpC family hydrolase